MGDKHHLFIAQACRLLEPPAVCTPDGAMRLADAFTLGDVLQHANLFTRPERASHAPSSGDEEGVRVCYDCGTLHADSCGRCLACYRAFGLAVPRYDSLAAHLCTPLESGPTSFLGRLPAVFDPAFGNYPKQGASVVLYTIQLWLRAVSDVTRSGSRLVLCTPPLCMIDTSGAWARLSDKLAKDVLRDDHAVPTVVPHPPISQTWFGGGH